MSILSNRKFWAGLVLSVALLMVLATYAKAADKGGAPVTAAEAARLAPTNPWSACHAGVTIGVVAGVMDPIYGVDGYQYGGALGCDLQINQLVIGAFTDYSWKHVTAFGNGVDGNAWTFGGRAGFLVNSSTLLYGLVGRSQLRIDGMGETNGLAIGGGIETLLRPDVSVALEYRRSTYDDITDGREHTVGVRLSYRVPVAGFNK